MLEFGSNQFVQVHSDDASAVNKKRPPRRNPWGNSSYADLITQAIETSPEKKLTLSQIYDWMVRNIPHFSNQGASNSSAGWKNSIRHNLSLHKKFLRIKNESSNGKSSWWTINTAAGMGRTTRRKNIYRKRKNKGSFQQKTEILRKLSELNVDTESSPISSNNQYRSTNLQLNISKLALNLQKRRWQSCSSNSSEDNTSCHSSPLTFHTDHEYQGHFNCTLPVSYQTVDAFFNESSSILNANSDRNQLIPNGIETFYSLGNKCYTFCNATQHIHPREEHIPKIPSATFAVEENICSKISREYFKSPHHLSGSYMTLEVGKFDRIQNTISELENSNLNSISISKFGSRIHQCSSFGKTFELKQETLFEGKTFKPQPLIPSPQNVKSEIEAKSEVLFQIHNKTSTEFALLIKKQKSEGENSGDERSEDQSNNSCEQGVESKYEAKSLFDENIDNSISMEEITNVIDEVTEEGMRKKSFKMEIEMEDDRVVPDVDSNSRFCENIPSIDGSESSCSQDSPIDFMEILTHTLSTALQNANEMEFTREDECHIMKYIDSVPTEFPGLYSSVSVILKFDDVNKSDVLEESIYSMDSTDTISESTSDVIAKNGDQPTPRLRKNRVLRVCFERNNGNTDSFEKTAESLDEVTAKTCSLLQSIVNVILSRVQVLSNSPKIVTHILARLNRLSESFNLKQMLFLVTELLILVNATHFSVFSQNLKYQDTLDYLNYTVNFSKYNYDTVREVLENYLNILISRIGLYTIESLLSDSRIRNLENPPEVGNFLSIYINNFKTEVISVEKYEFQVINDVSLLSSRIYQGFCTALSFSPEIEEAIMYTQTNSQSYNLVSSDFDSPFTQISELYQPSSPIYNLVTSDLSCSSTQSNECYQPSSTNCISNSSDLSCSPTQNNEWYQPNSTNCLNNSSDFCCSSTQLNECYQTSPINYIVNSSDLSYLGIQNNELYQPSHSRCVPTPSDLNNSIIQNNGVFETNPSRSVLFQSDLNNPIIQNNESYQNSSSGCGLFSSDLNNSVIQINDSNKLIPTGCHFSPDSSNKNNESYQPSCSYQYNPIAFDFLSAVKLQHTGIVGDLTERIIESSIYGENQKPNGPYQYENLVQHPHEFHSETIRKEEFGALPNDLEDINLNKFVDSEYFNKLFSENPHKIANFEEE